jgi:phosphoserine phosphatase
VYRRRGVEHQASAPGEAPASDTGRLAGSGTVVYDAENIAARVNLATIYARRLEVGDDKIEPRPYARRALAEKVQEIQDVVKDQIDKALKE